LIAHACVLFLPVGAYIALRPMLRRGADGQRRLYLANLLVGLALLAIFVLLVGALAEEVYRCDVLRLANCD
jgi:hypothetical protein